MLGVICTHFRCWGCGRRQVAATRPCTALSIVNCSRHRRSVPSSMRSIDCLTATTTRCIRLQSEHKSPMISPVQRVRQDFSQDWRQSYHRGHSMQCVRRTALRMTAATSLRACLCRMCRSPPRHTLESVCSDTMCVTMLDIPRSSSTCTSVSTHWRKIEPRWSPLE